MKTPKPEIYITNGHFFNSYEDVEKYAKEKGLRIVNTETLHTKKGIRHLITLGA